jgi:hypothetical protein
MCHAIARAGTSDEFANSCIYCQLESEDVVELRLVPEDASSVDNIYREMTECAALNPDTVEEDEGDFFYDHDEVNGKLEASSNL